MIIKNRLVKKFTTVPNAIITDQNISDRALRIYLYLISKPDGWQVNNADVMKQLNIKSEETLSAAWKGLIETGWINRTHKIGANGKFLGGYDYALNEFPHAEINGQNTEPGKNPDPGKTRSSETSGSGENREHNKTKINNIINTKDLSISKGEGTANYLSKMWDEVEKTWQQIARDLKVKFTNREWDMIYGYIIAKPSLQPHQITTAIITLDKWAKEGLDIENALLVSQQQNTLRMPFQKIVYDKNNRRIYGQHIAQQRNKIIESEELERTCGN